MHLFRERWNVPVHLCLAALSGLLVRFLFPPYDLRWLAAIALAPLLIALAREDRIRFRFLYGWVAGIVYWFGICNWIQFVLEVHGGMGRWGGWGAFALFTILKALHLGVFSALAGPLMWRAYALPVIAALWVGIERTHGTFGFAWLALGNAGIHMSVPLRLAPLVGVYGLSFVFAMLAVATAVVVLRYPRLFLVPLVALGSLYLLPAIPEGTPARQHALSIQPNVDTETEWTQEKQAQLEQQLYLLSNAATASIVVWPELPAPLYYYDDPAFRSIALDVARRHDFFLFGTVAYTSDHRPLNSAILLANDGHEIGRYDKVNLVPFGEFVPPLFGFVNRIAAEISDFSPGKRPFVLPAGANRLGVFICYESAFPDFVRQFARQGADVYFNLSNDGYFGKTAAREQHLLLVRMRAVENRRFIVRSTNDGITSSIDPAGIVLRRLPLYKELAATLPFDRVATTTFYTRHGDWFAWCCLLIGVGLSVQTQIASHVRRPRPTVH